MSGSSGCRWAGDRTRSRRVGAELTLERSDLLDAQPAHSPALGDPESVHHLARAHATKAGDRLEELDDAAREEIEAAAREVGSQRTVEAMAAVEQHALDVCGTPLSR